MSKVSVVMSGVLILTLGLGGYVQASMAKEDITAIREITRGAHVTLQGKVTRILDDDEFRLEDDSGSVRIYIGSLSMSEKRLPSKAWSTMTWLISFAGKSTPVN